MGDRCHLELWVRVEDVEKFTDIVYGVDVAPDNKTDQYAYFTDDQANMGLIPECLAAAKQGLRFFGRHTGGESYGWYAFYSEDGWLQDFQTGYDFEGVVINPSVDGDVSADEFPEELKRYRIWSKMYEKYVEDVTWPVMT